MRFDVFQLANDWDAYGTDSGGWIVVTKDNEHEITGPMGESDARLFANALNALVESKSILLTAMEYFPKSIRNNDGFRLHNVMANSVGKTLKECLDRIARQSDR